VGNDIPIDRRTGRHESTGSTVVGRGSGSRDRIQRGTNRSRERGVVGNLDRDIRVSDEGHDGSRIKRNLDSVLQRNYERSGVSGRLVRRDFKRLTDTSTGSDDKVAALELIDVKNRGTVGDENRKRTGRSRIRSRNSHRELLERRHFSDALNELAGSDSGRSVANQGNLATIGGVELNTDDSVEGVIRDAVQASSSGSVEQVNRTALVI